MTERWNAWSGECVCVCVSDPVRVFYLLPWVICDTYEMLSIFCFVPLCFMSHSTGTENPHTHTLVKSWSVPKHTADHKDCVCVIRSSSFRLFPHINVKRGVTGHSCFSIFPIVQQLRFIFFFSCVCVCVVWWGWDQVFIIPVFISSHKCQEKSKSVVAALDVTRLCKRYTTYKTASGARGALV